MKVKDEEQVECSPSKKIKSRKKGGESYTQTLTQTAHIFLYDEQRASS